MTDANRPDVALSHTNARGTMYYLCSVPGKTGKSRLVASRNLIGTPLQAMPAGYEFAENVNGVVSVRKVRAEVIRPDELETVRVTLAASKERKPYRVAIERDEIVIYEPSVWPAGLEELADEYPGGWLPDGFLQRMQQVAFAHATYSPLVRFVLTDADDRTFQVERRFFRGDGGWLPVRASPVLAQAAQHAVQHLGPKGPKDTLFEWF